MNFLKSVCSKINQQKKPIGNVFRNGFSIYEKSLVNSNRLQKTGLLGNVFRNGFSIYEKSLVNSNRLQKTGLLGNLLTYQKSLYANGLQPNRARFLRNFSTGLMINKKLNVEVDRYVFAKTLVILDTDNCQIPKLVKPTHIAHNISKGLASAKFLGPVTIEAVGKPLPDFVTKQLRSSGIRVTQVFSDKLNATDTKLVLRMAIWALDNPEPANILLVAGDGDYQDIVDHLRTRGHNVMLAQIIRSSNLMLKITSKIIWEWGDLASGRGPLREEEKLHIREKYLSKYLGNRPKSQIAEAPSIRCELCYHLLPLPKKPEKLQCRCSYMIDLTSATPLTPQTTLL